MARRGVQFKGFSGEGVACFLQSAPLIRHGSKNQIPRKYLLSSCTKRKSLRVKSGQLSHHHVHVTRYPSDINQTTAAKDGATSSVLSGKPSE
ncbi:hypothetical protein CCACVL1_26608, partial [Corchorus capsularis]